MMRITYYRSSLSGEWYWQVVASNGRTILRSDPHKQKASMLRTIANVKNTLRRAKLEQL